MSFVDELKDRSEERAKALTPEAKRKAEAECYIDYSMQAIKSECEYAAGNGKRKIDGIVFFDRYDGKCHTINNVKKHNVSEDMILKGFKRNEERWIIEEIRNGVKKLGFANYEIKSYHPDWCIGSYVNFCIEVHIKW